MEMWQTYCPNCQKLVLGQRETVNTVAYVLLTLFSCGFWLIIWWIMAATFRQRPFLCTICGTPGINEAR